MNQFQIEMPGCIGRACWSGKAKGLPPLHLCADLGQVDIGSARIGRRAATDAGRALNIILDENGGLSSQSIGAGIQWTFEMNPVWGGGESRPLLYRGLNARRPGQKRIRVSTGCSAISTRRGHALQPSECVFSGSWAAFPSPH